MEYVYQVTDFIREHKFWAAALAPFVIGFIVLRIIR